MARRVPVFVTYFHEGGASTVVVYLPAPRASACLLIYPSLLVMDSVRFFVILFRIILFRKRQKCIPAP
jgi:hypothetical protein